MKSDAENEFARWVSVLGFMDKTAWRHVTGYVFKSPAGSYHDLSAADLCQLDRIEEEKIFLAEGYPCIK